MMKAKLFIARHLRILAARMLQLARRLEFVAVPKEPSKEVIADIQVIDQATVDKIEELVKGYESKR